MLILSFPWKESHIPPGHDDLMIMIILNRGWMSMLLLPHCCWLRPLTLTIKNLAMHLLQPASSWLAQKGLRRWNIMRVLELNHFEFLLLNYWWHRALMRFYRTTARRRGKVLLVLGKQRQPPSASALIHSNERREITHRHNQAAAEQRT